MELKASNTLNNQPKTTYGYNYEFSITRAIKQLDYTYDNPMNIIRDSNLIRLFNNGLYGNDS